MSQVKFPISVHLVERPRVLFRAVHGPEQPELIEAMRSNYDAQRPPHPSDRKATVLHMAVSMFEDGGALARFASRAPERLGTYVARVELRPGQGVCIADTGNHGHWSVWGRPDVLAAMVTTAISVRS